MHTPDLVRGTHRSHSVNCSFTDRGFHNLIHHRTPESLDFLAPPNAVVPQVDQLPHYKWGLPDPLIMPLFPSASSSQHPLTGPVKSHSEPGLVLGHPVLHLAWYWVLDTSQKKIYGKTRLLSKHEEEWRLTSAQCRVRLKRSH
ncbi:unnamed protein product [Merluccius merluccius]